MEVTTNGGGAPNTAGENRRLSTNNLLHGPMSKTVAESTHAVYSVS